MVPPVLDIINFEQLVTAEEFGTKIEAKSPAVKVSPVVVGFVSVSVARGSFQTNSSLMCSMPPVGLAIKRN